MFFEHFFSFKTNNLSKCIQSIFSKIEISRKCYFKNYVYNNYVLLDGGIYKEKNEKAVMF